MSSRDTDHAIWDHYTIFSKLQNILYKSFFEEKEEGTILKEIGGITLDILQHILEENSRILKHFLMNIKK